MFAKTSAQEVNVEELLPFQILTWQRSSPLFAWSGNTMRLPHKNKFPGNLVKRWFQVLAVFGSTATQLCLRKAFLEAPEELGEGDANSNLPKLSAFL